MEINHQQREIMLIDALEEAVVLLNDQGQVLHANAVACHSLGLTREQLHNQKLHEHFILDDQTQLNTRGICLKAIDNDALKRGFICADHVRKITLPNQEEPNNIALIWCPVAPPLPTRDSSTGLPDRNMLIQQLTPLLKQAYLSNPHSLVKLKIVQKNNTPIGTADSEQVESLMTDITALLSPHIRNRDLLARSDLDCFMLLLRGCDLTHAEQITQKLLEEVQCYHDEYPDTELPSWKVCAGIIPLTVGKAIDETFEKAETACQQAYEGDNKPYVLNEGNWESE